MDYPQPNFGGQTALVDNNYNSYDHMQQQSVDGMAVDNGMMYGNEQPHLQPQQFDQVPNDQSDYWNQQNSNEVSNGCLVGIFVFF